MEKIGNKIVRSAHEQYQIDDHTMALIGESIKVYVRAICEEKGMLPDWARMFAAEVAMHAKLILINWDYI